MPRGMNLVCGNSVETKSTVHSFNTFEDDDDYQLTMLVFKTIIRDVTQIKDWPDDSSLLDSILFELTRKLFF